MDYILNILLLIFILLINSFYYRNTKIYNKLRRIFYVIIFLGILILLKLNLSEKEKFNQKGGNPKKNKIDKLKMLCGIPENDESTSHCFADGTQISLANGDVKNIEDIVVGDLVIGWNGESLDTSEVTAIDHRHTVGSHADACKQLGDEPSLYTLNISSIIIFFHCGC